MKTKYFDFCAVVIIIAVFTLYFTIECHPKNNNPEGAHHATTK